MNQRNRQTQTAAPQAAPAPQTQEGPMHGPARNPKHRQCACGCEGWTRGGTWLPGHDAKAASAAKLAAGTLKSMPRLCKCGCTGMTKGGIFLPGHDAKYHSAQRQVTQTQIAA